MLNDANLSNVNILPRLNWSAYFPGSVFGRDGFDDSFKWNNTSIENGWMSITNSFVYQNSGTGVIDFRVLLGEYRKMLTNESIDVMTHDGNSYSGNLTIASASFTLGTTPIIQKTPLQTMSLQSVLEDTMIPDTKYSDMSVVNSGDNFSIPYVNDFFSSSITNMISIPENN